MTKYENLTRKYRLYVVEQIQWGQWPLLPEAWAAVKQLLTLEEIMYWIEDE